MSQRAMAGGIGARVRGRFGRQPHVGARSLGLGLALAMAALLALGSPAGAAAATRHAFSGPVSHAPWDGGEELFRADAFTTQPNFNTCVPTSVQIMLNLINARSDHSLSQINSYYTWGRARNAYRYKTAGLDPSSWSLLLSNFGAGPYSDRSFASFDDALTAATYELRLTNKPVGLLVENGHHAWVMTGFTASADPLTAESWSVESVTIMGPLYPMQQKGGYDPPPGTTFTPDQLAAYLLPYAEVFPVRWTSQYVIVAPTLLSPALDDLAPVSRLAGADRYGTALAISQAAFSGGARTVYLASGRDYGGALVAGPAAALAQGPVLLADGPALRGDIAAELARLHPRRIIAVGDAFDDAFLALLRPYASTVSRIGGSDHVGLALAVSRATFVNGAPVAYLATGSTFPDALAGGAQAARQHGPVLLTDGSTTLPASVLTELRRLHPSKIMVLGSSAAVADSVAAAAATVAPVTRLAGPDRYGTAVAVSSLVPAGAPVVYVATGANYPDALAVAPAAARTGAPVLLVPWASIPDAVVAELQRLQPGRIVVLGGTSVVSDSVAGF
ncbi:MAG: cell wall-binding repeat-containing protein [Candidatus Limnocylindrales bacterium]